MCAQAQTHGTHTTRTSSRTACRSNSLRALVLSLLACNSTKVQILAREERVGFSVPGSYDRNATTSENYRGYSLYEYKSTDTDT